MNESQFIGKVQKIYPMQKSTGGYEYITFLLRVPKIMRLDHEYETIFIIRPFRSLLGAILRTVSIVMSKRMISST